MPLYGGLRESRSAFLHAERELEISGSCYTRKIAYDINQLGPSVE